MNNLQNWEWRQAADKTYLTCKLLSDWQHGFFTKNFYPQTPEDLTSILQPKTSAYRVKQVHGNVVLTTQEINQAVEEQELANPFPDADGVISDRPNQSVWAASADCTPILIGDRLSGRVCAIHAGWRGTSLEIVKKAIARFVEFGSDKENLRIAIGPAISGVVYQVDDWVAVKVGKTIISNSAEKQDLEILEELKALPDSPVSEDDIKGKSRLNVSRVNQIQLEQLNINPEHIAIAKEFCTYQQQDLLFSYRRTGERKVQWSGIITNY